MSAKFFNLTLGAKLIMISTVFAIISFVFDWYTFESDLRIPESWGIEFDNGWGAYPVQFAALFMWIYPVYAIWKAKPLSKFYALCGITVFTTLITLDVVRICLRKPDMDGVVVPAFGLLVFGCAIVILVAGIFIHCNSQQNEAVADEMRSNSAVGANVKSPWPARMPGHAATGSALLVLGLLLLCYAVFMDVSVDTQFGSIANVGLLADRQFYLMLAGFLSIAGLLLVLLKRSDR